MLLHDFPDGLFKGGGYRNFKPLQKRAAFVENLTHHNQQIPALFWFSAPLIASHGRDSRVGTQTGLKRFECEDEPRRMPLELGRRGTGAIAPPEDSRLRDLGGEFHPALGAHGRADADQRTESPIPRREPHSRREARGAPAGARLRRHGRGCGPRNPG